MPQQCSRRQVPANSQASSSSSSSSGMSSRQQQSRVDCCRPHSQQRRQCSCSCNRFLCHEQECHVATINMDGCATYLLGRHRSLLLALAIQVYFSPLEGSSSSWLFAPFVIVVVVVIALGCNLIRSSSRSPCLQCALFYAIAMPSESSPCPSGGACCRCLISLARCTPQSCAAIDRHCPWAA